MIQTSTPPSILFANFHEPAVRFQYAGIKLEEGRLNYEIKGAFYVKIIKPAIISVCFQFTCLRNRIWKHAKRRNKIFISDHLQVEQIQAETVIYEAKLARQKAVSELRNLDLNGVASATPAITPSSGYSSLADTDIPAQRVAAKSLRVIEIFGTPQQMSARISLLDGSVTDVKVGQSIPGTPYKVASITGNGVWIQNGTEKRQLIL